VALLSSAPHISAPPPGVIRALRSARQCWAARKRAARDRDQTASGVKISGAENKRIKVILFSVQSTEQAIEMSIFLNYIYSLLCTYVQCFLVAFWLEIEQCSNRHRTLFENTSITPLSFEVPAKRNPLRVSVYSLYFQKLVSLAYILSLLVWVYLHSNLYCGLQMTHLFCTRVLFGRSRSFKFIHGRWFWYQSKKRIRLPISRSSWLWTPILHRLWDTVTNWLRIAYVCYIFATPLSFGALAPYVPFGILRWSYPWGN